MKNIKTPTKASLKQAISYIEVFADPCFSPGEVVAAERNGDVITMGYFSISETFLKFIEMLYKRGFIIDFDWPGWSHRAQDYMDHPEAVAKARLSTLIRLLTTHSRADRFNDGHLYSVYRNGHLTNILQRLEAIYHEKYGR